MADPVASRPRFPSGYGIHADDDGLVPWRDAEEKLEQARNYWIGTTRPDGSPHSMPVWGLWVDGSLYFNPVFRVRPRCAYAWVERDYTGTATRYAFT